MSQIVHLCGEGVLKPFCDLLAAKDDKTVGVVLDGVSNILATAEKLAEVDKVKSTNGCMSLASDGLYFHYRCAFVHLIFNRWQ